MTYVETASDHIFSQFLSRMTPSKALKDRPAMFSKSEKQIDRFFRQGIEIALRRMSWRLSCRFGDEWHEKHGRNCPNRTDIR